MEHKVKGMVIGLSRPDVSSTSMVPIHSDFGNMALINGHAHRMAGRYLDLTGIQERPFTIQNSAIVMEGNGAYAILQS